ncbi:MAG: hypothetical protein ABEK50_00230, partial [bacterium]
RATDTVRTERTTGEEFTNKSLSGGLYYALGDPRGLSMGVGVKAVQQTLYKYTTTDYAGDIGLQYRTPSFSFGAAVRNIGPEVRFTEDGAADPMPETHSVGLAQGFQFLYMDWIVTAEGTRYVPEAEDFVSAGVEVTPFSFLELRSGVRNPVDVPNQKRSVRAGLGLKLPGLTVDYSFTGQDLLDDRHTFSVTLKFGSR